ncbi:MAG: FAD:protein FMN transferase [Oceanospirillaceae bacterium]|nr:FAD:protein FMN transferase [Oceanospirillaceae bacterium]
MADFKSLVRWPVALLLAVFVLTGCDLLYQEKVVGFEGRTMGTTYSVKWVDANEARVQALKHRADEALASVNKQMSTYDPTSELSTFNKLPAGSEMEVSDALAFVARESLTISADSNGAFDVTVGPLVNLWGFGPDGRIEKAPTEAEIDLLKPRIGYANISVLENPTRLKKAGDQYVDLSAIAKGYGVDVLAQLLEDQGINNYLVEIGGELRARGVKPEGEPWRIAIESPVSSERSIGRIINVKDTGIATSGDYRNYFEENGVRFSHTIDPATARPITHRLASVTVLRPTCAEADALATTLMVLGDEAGFEFAKERGIAAYFLVKDAESDGFVEKATVEFEQFVQTQE